MQQHLDLLACPDCRGRLDVVEGPERPAAMGCLACSLLFPIVDGIPILLPSSARNHAMESPLVEALARDAGALRGDDLKPRLERTRVLLASVEGRKCWEWEDEAFWTATYQRRSAEDSGRMFEHRLWQREFLTNQLLRATSLAGKTIVDVGCGAGTNFRKLFSHRCDASTLYVAADISLDGLRLNRSRNPHANGLYVLCSADRLPFQEQSIDVLCYFGILHHTERKSATLREDVALVKRRGYMVIDESVERPSLMPEALKGEVVESAHEERVDLEALMDDVRQTPELQIVVQRRLGSGVIRIARKVQRRILPRSRSAYEVVAGIDRAVVRTLGTVVPHFRPAQVMLLLHRV